MADKRFISQHVQGNKISESIPVSNVQLEDEHFEKFKNSQFASFHGLLTLFFGFFFLVIAIASVNLSMIFLVLFGALMFFILSMQMHFFKVSDKFLLVQNHNFFWRRKIYRLEDIKEAVFETQSKMPNSLRIITRDFKQGVYPAATLSDRTWLGLMDKLESKKIIVRDELAIRD
ncbi:MAG: hypothetical protein EOP56_01275 [Sphingobacteriales bacterium]|nr:MAG: hypothetical protein EOP56_01275 [Sphingobacteriales bacterium]